MAHPSKGTPLDAYTTAKEAEGLSYLELKDLLEKKKEAEIEKVTKELTAARGIVASLEAQLANLGMPMLVGLAGSCCYQFCKSVTTLSSAL
jgi:hypothetical protein